MLRLLLVSVVLAVAGTTASAKPGRQQTPRIRCLPHGTIYLSRGYDPSRQYIYELIVYEKLDYSHDATVDADWTDWTIRTLDRHTGKVLSDLLLGWGCPVGRGNCLIGPRFVPEKSDTKAIDVVPVGADFTPAVEPKSYAIIIPGFADWQEAYVDSFESYGDLKFFTPDQVVPDLSGQLIWVRAACSGRSSGH